ncbi:hypothetical protein VUR80DRAFT_699 [Thermomyces stellatus]
MWTACQRHLLVCLLGYVAFASSLTASIYFPLFELLAIRYGVSMKSINMTITLFFAFQSIAPSFWSPLYDSLGRRPVYPGLSLRSGPSVLLLIGWAMPRSIIGNGEVPAKAI